MYSHLTYIRSQSSLNSLKDYSVILDSRNLSDLIVFYYSPHFLCLSYTSLSADFRMLEIKPQDGSLASFSWYISFPLPTTLFFLLYIKAYLSSPSCLYLNDVTLVKAVPEYTILNDLSNCLCLLFWFIFVLSILDLNSFLKITFFHPQQYVS